MAQAGRVQSDCSHVSQYTASGPAATPLQVPVRVRLSLTRPIPRHRRASLRQTAGEPLQPRAQSSLAAGQLRQRSSLVVAPMMPAMTCQRRHALGILAVGRAKLLARGSHTRTCHVSAFGRCCLHRILLKVLQASASRSAHFTRSPRSLAQRNSGPAQVRILLALRDVSEN